MVLPLKNYGRRAGASSFLRDTHSVVGRGLSRPTLLAKLSLWSVLRPRRPSSPDYAGWVRSRIGRVAFRVSNRRTAIMLARAGSAIAIAPSSSVLVAGLRAVMRPLLQDPGYAVIALKHDIDPPGGWSGDSSMSLGRFPARARRAISSAPPFPIPLNAGCYVQHADVSA
jgi:hypothetical protein